MPTLKSRVSNALAGHPRAFAMARRAWFAGRYVARRPHERDYELFRRLPVYDGLFLDVGANIGMSALSYRIVRPRAPVLSIEANPAHARDLAAVGRLLRRDYEFRILAAGEQAGSAVLHVPTYRGTPLSGEATLLDDAPPSWWVHERGGSEAEVGETAVSVDVRPLDELGVRPAVIKVDVEGFTLSVLRGLRETIAATSPVLLLEAVGDDDVMRELEPAGYRPWRYVADRGEVEAWTGQPAANLFFLPPGLRAPGMPG
jgi:FkbM family methyltransferase